MYSRGGNNDLSHKSSFKSFAFGALMHLDEMIYRKAMDFDGIANSNRNKRKILKVFIVLHFTVERMNG